GVAVDDGERSLHLGAVEVAVEAVLAGRDAERQLDLERLPLSQEAAVVVRLLAVELRLLPLWARLEVLRRRKAGRHVARLRSVLMDVALIAGETRQLGVRRSGLLVRRFVLGGETLVDEGSH